MMTMDSSLFRDYYNNKNHRNNNSNLLPRLSTSSTTTTIMQQQQQNQKQQRRQFASSTTTNDEDDKDKDEDDKNKDNIDVNYIGPLGDLISRLKMVSITGCVLSICVIPGLVFLKHGDLPSARQATLGSIATFGALGSTGALHFVFGSYVLNLKSVIVVPINRDDDENEKDDQEEEKETSDDSNSNSNDSLLLFEATTRSVFGFWKNTYIFDPIRDVTSYKGSRPFANFCIDINDGTKSIPLYVHPDKLDSITRQLLLHNNTSSSIDSKETKDENGVNEGTMTTAKKKKNDDNDEFF
jgi:hypothetical protein